MDQAGSPPIHTSPYGVIPKKDGNNRWRLILDLSSPHGHSVHDGIEKRLAYSGCLSADGIFPERCFSLPRSGLKPIRNPSAMPRRI